MIRTPFSQMIDHAPRVSRRCNREQYEAIHAAFPDQFPNPASWVDYLETLGIYTRFCSRCHGYPLKRWGVATYGTCFLCGGSGFSTKQRAATMPKRQFAKLLKTGVEL